MCSSVIHQQPVRPGAINSFPKRRSSDLAADKVFAASPAASARATIATRRQPRRVTENATRHGPSRPSETAIPSAARDIAFRSEEHTSELQSPDHLVSRLLLEKKNHYRQH